MDLHLKSAGLVLGRSMYSMTANRLRRIIMEDSKSYEGIRTRPVFDQTLLVYGISRIDLLLVEPSLTRRATELPPRTLKKKFFRWLENHVEPQRDPLKKYIQGPPLEAIINPQRTEKAPLLETLDMYITDEPGASASRTSSREHGGPKPSTKSKNDDAEPTRASSSAGRVESRIKTEKKSRKGRGPRAEGEDGRQAVSEQLSEEAKMEIFGYSDSNSGSVVDLIREQQRMHDPRVPEAERIKLRKEARQRARAREADQEKRRYERRAKLRRRIERDARNEEERRRMMNEFWLNYHSSSASDGGNQSASEWVQDFQARHPFGVGDGGDSSPGASPPGSPRSTQRSRGAGGDVSPSFAGSSPAAARHVQLSAGSYGGAISTSSGLAGFSSNVGNQRNRASDRGQHTALPVGVLPASPPGTTGTRSGGPSPKRKSPPKSSSPAKAGSHAQQRTNQARAAAPPSLAASRPLTQTNVSSVPGAACDAASDKSGTIERASKSTELMSESTVGEVNGLCLAQVVEKRVRRREERTFAQARLAQARGNHN
ncbi:unnamed protein product [Amoebophrya sp. A25]|nr:unnamed protein product [Amoebophrya sp. A25]|eukprot:GSA25T00012016001.1